MGSRESYETAYCCVAYLAAFMPITTLLLVIPYAGLLVSVALLTYLYVLISRKVHRIEVTRAWVVFGLIGVMLFFMGIGADIRAQDVRKSIVDLEKTTDSASLDHRSR
jgi:4-hydroxybenzoate polyprenyltransferase